MDVKPVTVHDSIFTIYDNNGNCCGRVNPQTGIALIGNSFWYEKQPDENYQVKLDVASEIGYTITDIENAITILKNMNVYDDSEIQKALNFLYFAVCGLDDFRNEYHKSL